MKNKRRSFAANSSLVPLILLFIGVPFLVFGLVMLFVPISPDSLNLYVNGVRQQATEANVRTFRLIFVGVFGGIGLITSIVGLVALLKNIARKRINNRLKEEGYYVWAEITGQQASKFRVNRYFLRYLNCVYNDGSRAYVFKSPPLRMSPIPFLRDNQVKVYCNRNDMSNYFVDVDGSVERGAEVIDYS